MVIIVSPPPPSFKSQITLEALQRICTAQKHYLSVCLFLSTHMFWHMARRDIYRRHTCVHSHSSPSPLPPDTTPSVLQNHKTVSNSRPVHPTSTSTTAPTSSRVDIVLRVGTRRYVSCPCPYPLPPFAFLVFLGSLVFLSLSRPPPLPVAEALRLLPPPTVGARRLLRRSHAG